MDSLQKQFGDKLKIFWVTFEPEQVIRDFWGHSRLTKNNSIPTIVEDSTVTAYFKHKSWPHEVWIYKGKIIALTGPDRVDSGSISQVLSGAAIHWPVKDDYYDFDGSKTPLFPGENEKTVPYVKVGGYRERVNGDGYGGIGIVRDTIKKTVRAYFVNFPVYNAYIYCWNNSIDLSGLVKPSFDLYPNQIVWEVKDKTKYIFLRGSGYLQDWLEKYGISFESLRWDKGQPDKDIYRSMINDLDSLLDLHVRWEKRKERVLVLVRTNNENKFKANGRNGDPEMQITENGTLRRFRQTSLNNLAWKINQFEGNPYVFDETGYTGIADLTLNIPSWTDIAAIRNALQPYGLDLKEEERSVDKLVFSEMPGK
jgi:hypothetical protein